MTTHYINEHGYLCSQLQQHSVETETLLLYAKSIKYDQEKIFASINKTDLVILAFPLYVDSMPSPVIEFLEQLVHYRDSEQSKGNYRKTTQFVALANCGFPEAKHNDTALAIAEQFSKRAGFHWRGGIGVGGGNGFGGKSLEEGKRTTQPIRLALEGVAEALEKGESIPQVAIDMAKQSPYPASLFRFGAQVYWKRAAAIYGVKRNIQDRPYCTE